MLRHPLLHLLLGGWLLGVFALRPAAAAEASGPGSGDERPVSGWTWSRSHLVLAAWNPIGLDTQTSVALRHRLFARDTVLFRDSFFAAGLAPRANPSYARIGPFVEVQPVAVFHLSAGAEYVGFYSTFGNLQSYRSPTADYSDRARERSKGAAYATSAFHATIEPTLQGRVGAIAVRNRLAAEYWRANLRRGDTVFYASALDTLAPNDGWVIYDNADVLYLGARDLVVGARFTRVAPMYRGRDFAPGDGRSVQNAYDQAGILATWTPNERTGRILGQPTFFALAAFYLDHRYRAGDPGARLTPDIVAGVSFELALRAARGATHPSGGEK